MSDSRAHHRSAGNTTLLMVLALVLIAGLFVWLSMAAEPTQMTVVEDPDSANVDVGSGDPEAAEVSLAEFGTGPQGYQSLNIRLRDVAVAATLGDRGFWIQLPNNQPYLVHIGDDLAASGTTVASGDTVTVSGTVRMMSDSTLNAWRSAGVLTDDLEMDEARFATSYLDARFLNQ
ncbi:MAG TPA: hypothetical protein VK837_11105 [Longimicrobiales bacterium]|nr:hypothetical protein [Longimicrobiales bacterium]